jgi:hypothetical protein
MYYDKDLNAYYINEERQAVKIDDAKPGEALYGVKEAVSVLAGDFIIAKENVNSYYSNLLLNLIALEYPFGDIIPFINDTFNSKKLDELISDKLKDKTITVPQYRTFTRAIGFLSCLSTIAVPSATRKTLVPPPGIAEMRDKLIAENKDKLTNPVVVADIEKQLVGVYKDYIKGDDSEGFFLKDKSFNSALKKSHIMFGAEPKIDNPNEVNLVISSLREGWKAEDLPQISNSLRMGSYNRGKETALGGEAAKFSSRIFQNTRIADEDCKTKIGMPTKINVYNYKSFGGRYKLVNGGIEEIKGNLKVGDVVTIRSPQTCNTINGNYCSICMGRSVSEAKIGLGPQASTVGSVFLESSLALFHAASIVTEPYDYTQAID